MHTYRQMMSAEFANQNESRNDLVKHSNRLASMITIEHRSMLDRSTTNVKNSFKTNETMVGVRYRLMSGYRRGSVVRASISNWRTFPHMSLIYG